MPVVKFNNADIRFPDNMSGDEISDVLGAMSEAAKAVGEVVGMLGSGAVAEPVAGLTGLMTGDTNAIRGMQERMTYTPRTQAGQRAMMRIGEDIRYMADVTGLQHVSGYWRDKVVPALQEQAGPIAGSALAALGLGALAAVTEMTPGGRVGSAGRRMAPNQEGAIKAFHGSPHDFDKFSTSQIGTGEGAQAYGHGLYFAESEDVAHGYRKQLSRGGGLSPMIGDEALVDVMERMQREADQMPIDKAGEVYERINFLEDLDLTDTFDEAIARIDDPNVVSWAEKEIKPNYKPAGHTYQVEIDADPEDFLDWDKPLSEQSDQVATKLQGTYDDFSVSDDAPFNAYLKKEFPSFYKDWGSLTPSQQNMALSAYRDDTGLQSPMVRGGIGTRDKPTMERLYSAMGDQPTASAALNDLGIKGIKYKDGFSRGTDAGTSNFVVFNEDLITISKKYGIAIPAAAALLSEQTGADPDSMYTTD